MRLCVLTGSRAAWNRRTLIRQDGLCPHRGALYAAVRRVRHGLPHSLTIFLSGACRSVTASLVRAELTTFAQLTTIHHP